MYEGVSGRGRAIAGDRYSEKVARARHLEYFTSLEPRGTPFDTQTTTPP